MSFPVLISLIAAVGAFLLALATLLSRPRSFAHWSFFVGMLACALERSCQVASLTTDSLNDLLFWQRLAVLPLSLLPVSWLVFSLAFARGNHREFLRKWQPGLLLFGALPIGLALGQWQSWISDAVWTEQVGHWVFPVTHAGILLHATIVISAVLIITNVEWTFRAAVGTARWKIKYAVLGIALLFGVRIFSSSQVILYSANNVQLITLNSIALALACLLLGVWAYRSRIADADLYPSTAALHKSLTALLAGAYLIVVGVLAKFVAALGWDETFPVKAMLILVALVGLGMLCLSDRVAQTTRSFISRHLQRPTHDYRAVWTTLTQRTTAVLDQQAFARAAVKVIADTFEALSVTLWLTDAARNKLTFAASTAIEPATAGLGALPEEILPELSHLFAAGPQPVDIDCSDESWCQTLCGSNPAFFPKGGHRYCLPLISRGDILGLIVLGDRVRGLAFSAEDLELFKCLGDQIAAGVCNLSLSDQLLRAKEMESFQLMSAFLVHDLKNTASALSLTLRNLPIHFENPAFREDALRTVAKSAGRVNELIGRLSSLREKLELHPAPADLNQIVAAALEVAGAMAEITIVPRLQPLPPFAMDRRQIESVTVNLLLNAKEAIGVRGEIRIETRQENGGALLLVADTGCGMTPEFLSNSLFKPFKTTKRNGLGIGMFQVKAIVEAHGGRIAAQSQPGQGSTFRVWLPIRIASSEKNV
ncbi:MAG: PEP-CTERM system histidine kinase PrsK [Verrucomicrobia subdivision 3 bacterium]|nr:PEP-CTERM system histidine kinase PrsK [Limisphaerales bacterium]